MDIELITNIVQDCTINNHSEVKLKQKKLTG